MSSSDLLKLLRTSVKPIHEWCLCTGFTEVPNNFGRPDDDMVYWKSDDGAACVVSCPIRTKNLEWYLPAPGYNCRWPFDLRNFLMTGIDDLYVRKIWLKTTLIISLLINSREQEAAIQWNKLKLHLYLPCQCVKINSFLNCDHSETSILKLRLIFTHSLVPL